MLEKCAHHTIDIAVAGALLVATVSAFFWHSEQRATIEVWKSDRAARLTVARD